MNATKYINFAHFHRRRLAVTTLCVSGYMGTCYKAKSWNSDLLRMGFAGSMAHTTVECLFHFVDTVNIRTKASEASISTMSMVNKIWAKEGIVGFGRGFSACFYGSAVGGFLYFCLYKTLKGHMGDYLPKTWDIGLVYATAALTSEALCLGVKYPFDLIKCRLQSVNYIFKYQNLVHAFKKEIKNNGVKSLYEGAAPFLLTYTSFIALQFSIYERILKMGKDHMSKDDFLK